MSNSKREERYNSLVKELRELEERYDAAKSWARKGYIMAELVACCDALSEALRDLETQNQGA